MDFNFLQQILSLFRKRGIVIIILLAIAGYFLYNKYPDLQDLGKPYVEKYSNTLEHAKRKVETIKQ